MEPIRNDVDPAAVETIPQLAAARVALTPAAPFGLVHTERGWREISWGEFGDEVERVAGGLASLGIGNGDCVSVLGWTRPEWCVADIAIQRVGAACVGVYPTLTAEQIAFILSDARCKAVIVEDEEQLAKVEAFRSRLAFLEHTIVWNQPPQDGSDVLAWAALGGPSIRDRSQPQAPAIIVYTSGTTGEPKGAVLTHANLIALLRGGASAGDVRFGDVTMAYLPMAHAAEHVLSFYSRVRFGSVGAFARSIDTVIDDAREVRPTYFGAVPRIFEKIHQRIHQGLAQAPFPRRALARASFAIGRTRASAQRSGRSVPLWVRALHPIADRLVLAKIRGIFGGRVRYAVSGAAPISTEILEFFHGCGLLILEGYGCTEICGLSHINRIDDYRFGSVGKPLEDVECRIADDGEILLRAPFVFAGYHDRPGETRAAIDAEGWLHTGDIGEVDSDGFLHITDRKKNLLKTAGGKYIAPTPIEQAIRSEDPLIGQVFVEAEGRPFVTALITLDPAEAPADTFDEQERPTAQTRTRLARAVARANVALARYERVRRFAVVAGEFRLEDDEITPTLKLRRHRIRERYGEILDALYEDPNAGFEPHEG